MCNECFFYYNNLEDTMEISPFQGNFFKHFEFYELTPGAFAVFDTFYAIERIFHSSDWIKVQAVDLLLKSKSITTHLL